MQRTTFPGARSVLRASVAPFLLLVTPLVAYLQYQRYSLANPEVVVFVLLMAAAALVLGAVSVSVPALGIITLAGLITFVVDIQARSPGLTRLGLLFLGLCGVLWLLRRHAHQIVSLVTATLLVLSVFSPGSEAITTEQAPDAAAGASAAAVNRPLILHLLLDEYIGVEGLPPDLTPAGFKDARRSYFVDRGFRLFGKAYSEYPVTLWSMPHVFNLLPGGYVKNLTVAGPTRGSHRLTRNAYFERLSGLGYAIQVHSPDFLYPCPSGMSASCRAYPSRSLGVLERLDMPISGKLAVVAGTFLQQSEAYARTQERYRRIRQQSAGRIPLPAWNWEQNVPAPAGTMPMFDAVAADLANAQRGTFVFAHILMPHYPYVYDANCAQRPEHEWLPRSDPDRVDVPHGIINVPEGRAARYAAYFQQVECTERKITGLLDAIPPRLRDDAIVIVQGDHGSRITLLDPTTVSRRTLALSDYADSFSTMFAVRAPGIEPGYDLRMAPITCLLRTLVQSDFRSTSEIESCSSPNTVFFATGGQGPTPKPLPDFSTDAVTPQAHAAPGASGAVSSRPPVP